MYRKDNEWLSHEIKEVIFFIVWGLLVSVVLVVFVGFGLKAFEGSFVRGKPIEFGSFLASYIIYYIIIVAGLIGLPVLKIAEMLATKRGESPDSLKKASWFSIFSVSYLHDPEQDGFLYKLSGWLGFSGKKNLMRWSLSMLRLFVIGALVFGVFGLLQTVSPKAQVIGIPQVTMQVTETAKVLFTAEPASFAETTLGIFVLSLLMGLNSYVCARFRLPVGSYWVFAFIVIAPLMGLGWMGWHGIIYSASETDLFSTFLFGWLGSSLTIAFGSWILWYVWHFMNNVFAKLREVVPANEDIVFVSIVFLVVILITYISVEVWLGKRRHKSSSFLN